MKKIFAQSIALFAVAASAAAEDFYFTGEGTTTTSNPSGAWSTLVDGSLVPATHSPFEGEDNLVFDGQYAKASELYVTTADNYGNGVIAADLIGEALNGEGQIATVFYDTDFFVTNQRYDAFKTTMAEKYPGIEIVSEQGFLDEGTCNIQGDAIMTQYPDIDAIFCHWDIPCEGVLSSVRAAGKSPLLSTIDLGNNIALEIASGNVLGLGAQRPYDQGVAEAMCAAYSLLGKEAPAYVAVAALRVDQSNILEAYSEVYYVDAPDWLDEAYEANQG